MPHTTRTISTVQSVSATISLPPSKSYTNRALIIAALADGSSTIVNPSVSDDSNFLVAALRDLGISVTAGKNEIVVEGTNGDIRSSGKEIYVGNAGTAMRFLAGLGGIINGDTRLTGDENMQKRPINDLLDALKAAGVKSTSANGFPPMTIHGGSFKGGAVSMKAAVSSQFVSAILMAAPYAKHELNLHISGKLSSLPYIDMTLHVMRTFGGMIDFIEPVNYLVHNDERYIGQEFHIEGDASAATYFCAAAAITGGTVRIMNLTADSLQGDIRFFDVAAQMGCTVVKHEDHIEVRGGHLVGIDIDMNEMPDCVPTLAMMAAFAKGPTTILNVAHLKFKETDRMTALATELTRLGGKVELTDDSIVIHPRPLTGAVVETYNDHRMAMSFAIAGLRIPGLSVKNPACVTKSFPAFWEEFQKIEKSEL